MLRCRKCLTILICLLILVSAICSYAEEEPEDFIDVFESNGKIIAIIEGKKSITLDLRAREHVRWSGSNGYLGALLTNDRFLVISTSSNAWQSFSLRTDESEKGVASLSPYIALLVTENRAIGFDASANQFIEVEFPIRDELVAAKVEKHVAVVITSNRAFGLATKSYAFTELDLRVQETIEEMKVTSSKATVRTSDRLLTFESSDATWKEHRLNSM